jgi:hypothetical protein
MSHHFQVFQVPASIFSSMNTKKLSINSLLNPHECFVGSNHAQNQSSQPSSTFQFGPSGYHLRTASSDDDPHQIRPLSGAHTSSVDWHNCGHPDASRAGMLLIS